MKSGKGNRFSDADRERPRPLPERRSPPGTSADFLDVDGQVHRGELGAIEVELLGVRYPLADDGTVSVGGRRYRLATLDGREVLVPTLPPSP